MSKIKTPRYIKENWFKILILLTLLFVISSFAYQLGINENNKKQTALNNIETLKESVNNSGSAVQEIPQGSEYKNYEVEAIQVGGIGSRINQITPYLLDDQGFLRPPEEWGNASFNRAGDIMDVNCRDDYYITSCKSDSGNDVILDNVIGCRVMLEDKNQNKARIGCTKLTSNSLSKDPEEVTFDEPINVKWKGKIIAYFQSGKDYGIKKIPEDKNFPFFYAGNYSDAFPEHVALDGTVEVTGKWTGITCAYQNTVFKRCVPDVEVREIRMAEPLENAGNFDWSKPYAFFSGNLSDDDYPDVFQETYTGGAHCCFIYKAFVKTGKDLKVGVTFDERDSSLWPEDVDNNGIYELSGTDPTFNYWKTSYADSPAPKIVLSFNKENSSFQLNLDLMKKPVPTQDDFKKKMEDIKEDERKAEASEVNGVSPLLWGYMLDLIYSGNEKSAWEFLDLAWPKSEQKKAEFKKDFQEQLKKSPYYNEFDRSNNK